MTPKKGDKYIHQKGNIPREVRVIWHQATHHCPDGPGTPVQVAHPAGWAVYGENNYFEWWEVAIKHITPIETTPKTI